MLRNRDTLNRVRRIDGVALPIHVRRPLSVALFATLLFLCVAATGSAEATSLTDAPEIRAFVDEATRQFGERGAKAATFLVAGMPDADRRSLTKEFLMENLRLAFRARESFPWAGQVPDELFLDCVLPYAQLDEPRDPWRADLHRRCSVMVRGCQTAGEAAQQINRTLFHELRVSYNPARQRPSQSPKESIEQGKATCTGLAILLANACRSVGIPARIAGTPRWVNKHENIIIRPAISTRLVAITRFRSGQRPEKEIEKIESRATRECPSARP